MKPQSAKAKGRNLQKAVRDELLKRAPTLEPDDIRSTSMGASGVDIQLSPAARKIYPFSIECKAQEAMNVWDSLKQAEENKGNHIPLLAFKRNHTKIYVALSLEDFLSLTRPEFLQAAEKVMLNHSGLLKKLGDE